MNPTGIANKPEQNLSIESGGTLTAVGWTSRHKISPPVEAELFFLTSLFIEPTDYSTHGTAIMSPHTDKAAQCQNNPRQASFGTLSVRTSGKIGYSQTIAFDPLGNK